MSISASQASLKIVRMASRERSSSSSASGPGLTFVMIGFIELCMYFISIDWHIPYKTRIYYLICMPRISLSCFLVITNRKRTLSASQNIFFTKKELIKSTRGPLVSCSPAMSPKSKSLYWSYKNLGKNVSELTSEWPIIKSLLTWASLLSITCFYFCFVEAVPSAPGTSIVNFIYFTSRNSGPRSSDDSMVLFPLPVLPITNTILAPLIFCSTLKPSRSTVWIDESDNSRLMTSDFLRTS